MSDLKYPSKLWLMRWAAAHVGHDGRSWGGAIAALTPRAIELWRRGVTTWAAGYVTASESRSDRCLSEHEETLVREIATPRR